VTSTYGYDAAGKLLSLSHAGSGGTLSSFDYSYDGVGNRVAVTETFTSTVAIAYTYDPLYRLTAADYSDLSYFHYAYDAVGNRLSYEITGGETITYTYDTANRMTSAGGVAYTWDDNGSLLDDGLNTYTYNQANRLTGVSRASGTYGFAYRCNGLSSDPWGIIGCDSNRVRQTVNGVTTDYVLDLAAGLTQVLLDGINTYLYGNGRIAQYTGTGSEYFLTDGLGSVRQLVDDTGSITLSKSYRPYGEVLNSAGSGSSNYGFTGEMTDNTGLIYLRARYLEPKTGRFLTRDIWQRDFTRPLSLNGWNYAEGNPINRIDPSGKWYCQSGLLPLTSDCKSWVETALTRLESSGQTGKKISEYFYARDKALSILGTGGGLVCGPLAYFASGIKIFFESLIPGWREAYAITIWPDQIHVNSSISGFYGPLPSTQAVAIFGHEISHFSQGGIAGSLSVQSELLARIVEYYLHSELGESHEADGLFIINNHLDPWSIDDLKKYDKYYFDRYHHHLPYLTKGPNGIDRNWLANWSITLPYQLSPDPKSEPKPIPTPPPSSPPSTPTPP
jgi:RHS repeat-associated protein